MKTAYQLIISLLDWLFLATELERERKKVLRKHFEQDFQEWKNKAYFYPVHKPVELRNMIERDTEYIANTLLSSSASLKKIPGNKLHFDEAGFKLWGELIREFFNKSGYHLVPDKKNLNVYFAFSDAYYLRKKSV